MDFCKVYDNILAVVTDLNVIKLYTIYKQIYKPTVQYKFKQSTVKQDKDNYKQHDTKYSGKARQQEKDLRSRDNYVYVTLLSRYCSSQSGSSEKMLFEFEFENVVFLLVSQLPRKTIPELAADPPNRLPGMCRE
jgi:hypothetical protein